MTTATTQSNDLQSKLKKVTTEALETLTQSLEAGKSEELVRYLDTMAKFPRYSMRNLFLIMAQMPEASQVMGYQSWKLFGRQVKQGEKAIRIWAPLKLKNNNGRSARDFEQRQANTDSDQTLIFRPVAVFDYSQTEGEPMPELSEVEGDPGECTERLKQFAKELGVKVGYSEDLRGDGVSKCGEILLRVGLTPAAEFHTLVHELAHEIIHIKEDRTKLSKTQKETEAEAVAYVVSKSIGLDTGSAASDYIQLYNGDTKTLTESLTTVQQTAARITYALLN
jgi:hypothetical protein